MWTCPYFNSSTFAIVRPPSVGISGCSNVKSCWPTSISEHNPQQFSQPELDGKFGVIGAWTPNHQPAKVACPRALLFPRSAIMCAPRTRGWKPRGSRNDPQNVPWFLTTETDVHLPGATVHPHSFRSSNHIAAASGSPRVPRRARPPVLCRPPGWRTRAPPTGARAPALLSHLLLLPPCLLSSIARSWSSVCHSQKLSLFLSLSSSSLCSLASPDLHFALQPSLAVRTQTQRASYSLYSRNGSRCGVPSCYRSWPAYANPARARHARPDQVCEATDPQHFVSIRFLIFFNCLAKRPCSDGNFLLCYVSWLLCSRASF